MHGEEAKNGLNVMFVERRNSGREYAYRIIYESAGKTFHSSITINKEMPDEINERYWNEIIEIPTNQHDAMQQYKEQYTILRINDLAHNPNFDRVHQEVNAQYGDFLRRGQLLGAKQSTKMFTISYILYFMLGRDYYQVEAEVDSVTREISIISGPEKISTNTGYRNSGTTTEYNYIIEWVQDSNPDLQSGVVVDVGSKFELFGTMYKIVFKLPTKYITVICYKEGNEIKVLSQEESVTLANGQTSASPFPGPKALIMAK